MSSSSAQRSTARQPRGTQVTLGPQLARLQQAFAKDPAALEGSVDAAVLRIIDYVLTHPNANSTAKAAALLTELSRDLPDLTPKEIEFTRQTLADTHLGYAVFRGSEHIRKATIFGSARSQPGQPHYELAASISRRLSHDFGWGIINGGGPGAMAAAHEAARQDRAFRIKIQLPFEPSVAADNDPLFAEMQFFSPRKVFLYRPASAVIAVPGGLGTLDEVFEVICLIQTGKGRPVPVVLADVEGGTYWEPFKQMLNEMADHGYISRDDLKLVSYTHGAEQAAQATTSYFRNYHSRHWAPKREVNGEPVQPMVMRMLSRPTDADLKKFNEMFSDSVCGGRPIVRLARPLASEFEEGAPPSVHRIAMVPDPFRLREIPTMVKAINKFEGIQLLEDRLDLAGRPELLRALSARTDALDLIQEVGYNGPLDVRPSGPGLENVLRIA